MKSAPQGSVRSRTTDEEIARLSSLIPDKIECTPRQPLITYFLKPKTETHAETKEEEESTRKRRKVVKVADIGAPSPEKPTAPSCRGSPKTLGARLRRKPQP